MKYACLLVGWTIVAGLMVVPSTRAQEGETKSPAELAKEALTLQVPAAKWTREELEATPKRAHGTEMLETKHRRRIDRPDPRLLEQKFAATVALELPKQADDWPHSSLKAHSELATSEPLRGILQADPLVNTHVFAALLDQNAGGREQVLADALLENLIKQVPKDRLRESDLAFIRNGESRSFIKGDRRGKAAEPAVMIFFVYGKTLEDCENNVNTLLTVLDEGMSRPVRLFLDDQRPLHAKQITDLQEKLAAAKIEHAEVEAKLKSLAELTPDLMLGLKQQQLALDVEAAGTQAKVAACEKILAAPAGQGEVSAARRSAAAAVMVEAEVALASIDARRAKLNELVANVKAKREFSTRLTNLANAIVIYPHQIRSQLSIVNRMDAEVERHAPLPVVDNRVTIQPIEWISQ